jgi:hypothetical protein
MKRSNWSKSGNVKALTELLVAIGLFALPAPAAAQTGFSGRWTLDKDMSADLTKATFVPQVTQQRRNTGGFSGGGFGRGGFGGRRQNGGDNTRGGFGATLTPGEKEILKQFADYARTLTAITIEQTDHATLTITDAAGRSHLFLTDGTKTPIALATATVDSVTKWDDPHMVTTFTIGPAEDLVFTYVLVPASKRMALRVRLDESGRPRADVPELRLVYRITQ